jgi:hypothetical protein
MTIHKSSPRCFHEIDYDIATTPEWILPLDNMRLPVLLSNLIPFVDVQIQYIYLRYAYCHTVQDRLFYSSFTRVSHIWDTNLENIAILLQEILCASSCFKMKEFSEQMIFCHIEELSSKMKHNEEIG